MLDKTTHASASPSATHSPGPWEYVPSNENHGPYVAGRFGGDICDCYTMSNLSDRAVCNGGTSKPIPFQGEHADANARLCAAAPEMLDQLLAVRSIIAEAAMTGFNCKEGNWAERLFKSQWYTSEAIKKATGKTR